jgi:hypothetical protein
VELRCEGDWSLTFRSGTCVVRYRKPAGQWQPLNANVFTHAPVVEGDGGKVPPAVTVIPV